MKLCVSAIAWDLEREPEAFQLLEQSEVRYIEYIPKRVENRADLKKTFQDRSLTPMAFQALLFGTSGLHLFKGDAEREALFNHLEWVFRQAEQLGVRAVVFGSPQNRRIDTDVLSIKKAHEIAVEFFREVAKSARSHHTIFCLEPNPAAYQCNFLTTALETAAFVRQVNQEGLSLNLDVGALTMNHEQSESTLESVFELVRHIHISEPHLRPVGEEGAQLTHEQVSQFLNKKKYEGIVSIEMAQVSVTLESDPSKRDLWKRRLEKAIHFVRSVYGAK